MSTTRRNTPFWRHLFRQWRCALLIGAGAVLFLGAAQLIWHCEAWFSQYMYRRGWTMGYFQIGFDEGMPDFQLEWYLYGAIVLVAVVFSMAVQFVLARLGYAILGRRLKFRVRRFLRTWAVAAIAIAPLYLLTVLPIALGVMYFQRRVMPGVGELTAVFWPTYFLLAPVSLSLIRVRRRSRVLTPRCRRCGYQLRGLSRPTCPECGGQAPS